MILYRSPDVVIDGVPWHIVVIRYKSYRPAMTYRFRPPAQRAYKPAREAARIPKGLARTMAKYRAHAQQAMGATRG